jgi:hypothetical protein
MGCCQSSTLSTSEQIFLYSEGHNIPALESEIQDLSSYAQLEVDLTKTVDSSTNILKDDFFSYTQGVKISTFAYGDKYTCFHKVSNKNKELLIIYKSALSYTLIESAVNNIKKLVQVKHDNLIQVIGFIDNEKDIRVITDSFGQMTLSDLLPNNPVDLESAFKLFKQVIRGVIEYVNHGVTLKSLGPELVYFINDIIKISPLATFPEDNEFYNFSTNELDIIGDLFVYLVTAKKNISASQCISMLEPVLIEKDLNMINNIFGDIEKRPSLIELLDHQWEVSKIVLNPIALNEQNQFKNLAGEVYREDSDNPSVANEDQSGKILYSPESSDKVFDFNSILLSKINPYEPKEPECIKICEILNEEMKEIIELDSEDEMDSFEKQRNSVGAKNLLLNSSISRNPEFNYNESGKLNFPESPILNLLSPKESELYGCMIKVLEAPYSGGNANTTNKLVVNGCITDAFYDLVKFSNSPSMELGKENPGYDYSSSDNEKFGSKDQNNQEDFMLSESDFYPSIESDELTGTKNSNNKIIFQELNELNFPNNRKDSENQVSDFEDHNYFMNENSPKELKRLFELDSNQKTSTPENLKTLPNTIKKDSVLVISSLEIDNHNIDDPDKETPFKLKKQPEELLETNAKSLEFNEKPLEKVNLISFDKSQKSLSINNIETLISKEIKHEKTISNPFEDFTQRSTDLTSSIGRYSSFPSLPEDLNSIDFIPQGKEVSESQKSLNLSPFKEFVRNI